MDSFYNYTPSSDELYHWGIKGMRWGIRRYQNPDGSLTPEGRKRYGVFSGTIERHNKKVVATENAERINKENAAKASKTISDMTDDELRERKARLQLEKDVLSLQKDISSFTPKQRSAGEEFASKLGAKLADSVINAAGDIAKDALVKAGKEALGLNSSKQPVKPKKLEKD